VKPTEVANAARLKIEDIDARLKALDDSGEDFALQQFDSARERMDIKEEEPKNDSEIENLLQSTSEIFEKLK